jgi:hypothetical protein
LNFLLFKKLKKYHLQNEATMSRIATLHDIIQGFVDAGFISIFRYMDGVGGGKEEITFLKKGGEPIAVLRTPYLPDLVKLHNTRLLEGDYVLTNLVLEFVPALPDLDSGWEEFIGLRCVVVRNIRIHKYDLFMRSMVPQSLSRSLSSSATVTEAVHSYQMTPEYFAAQ